MGYNYPGLFYLGESIKFMGTIDAVYFTKNWREARGCRIERKIAEEYGVKILEYDFLDKFKDEVTVKTLNNSYGNLMEDMYNIPIKVKGGN